MPENEDKVVIEDNAVSADPLHEDAPSKSKTRGNPHNPDNIVKRDVAFLQKKVADIEIAISEVQDTVQKIDIGSIDELKQRIDDIEDLTMVENAGIIELKKVLEGKPQEQTIPPSLEERIVKIEGELTAASMKTPTTSVEMDNLHKKMEEFEKQSDSLRQELENINKSITEKLQGVESRLEIAKPTVDFDLITSKFDLLRAEIDSMGKKKLEMDLKIAEFERKFESVENRVRESLVEGVMEQLKTNRKDITSTNIRIDSLESVSRDLISQTHNIENGLKKFESFERVSLLNKEIEEKIERFKFIEEEMKRLSSRVEMMYENIDERLDRVKNVEKRVPEISDEISNLHKDFDKIKIDMIDRMKREDVSRRMDEIQKSISSKLSETVSDHVKPFDKILSDNEKRLSSLEKNVYRKEDKGGTELNKRLEFLEERYNKGMEELKSVFYQKMNELRGRIQAIQVPTSDEQIAELVNRTIFLESRLAALESITRQSSQALPIVIE